MPVNFGQYVYQPRPLQNWDIGKSFFDLADARFKDRQLNDQAAQSRASLAEQRAGRNDTNTRFAATVASEQNAATHDLATKRHGRVDALIQKARAAWAAGRLNEVDAYIGAINELGGSAERIDRGPGNLPDYRFKSPNDPELQTPDYAGTRSQIFGGGAPGGPPPGGGPFQMRSNVGPGAGPLNGRNPFEYLPGMSAARAPGAPPQAAAPSPAAPPAAAPPLPVDTAGPPPGAAVDGPAPDALTPAEADLAALEAAETGEEPPLEGAQSAPGAQLPEPQKLQLTPPNPYDPYALNTGQMMEQNRLRLEPYLQATENAYPVGEYQGRVRSLNQGVQSLGLPPEESLKIWQPTLNTVTSMMRSEQNQQAASARLATSQAQFNASRNDRLEGRAWREAKDVLANEDLKETKKKLKVAEGAYDLLRLAAAGNGDARFQLVAQMYRMNQAGVMTDKDFEGAKQGVVTLWTKIKQGAFEAFVQDGGVDPDKEALIKELLDVGLRRNVEFMRDAQGMLWNLRERAGSEEERRSVERAIHSFIPREYWTPEVSQAFSQPVPQKTGPMDQSGNYGVGKAPAQTRSSTSASASRSSTGDSEVDAMDDAAVLEELKKRREELNGSSDE